jgi:Zn-dependent protease with chaperone function
MASSNSPSPRENLAPGVRRVEVVSWAMYDFANSGYTTVVITAIFNAYFVSVIALEIVFGILASTIVMWFSRQREFRADAGGAHLAGRESMIGALQRLAAAPGAPLPGALQAFGIQSGQITGWRRMFLSHPPLEERIARLRAD